MTEETKAPAVPRRAATYLYFLTPYFVSVGVLYLWGFWSSFDINILEFLSITDVVRLTAYPIISAFAAFIVGALISESTLGRSLPSGGGRNTPTGRFLRKFAPVLVCLYLLGTLILFFSGNPMKWYVLPVILGVPLALVAKERGLLIDLIPSDSYRSAFLFVLITLIPFAYGRGRIDAADIAEGRIFNYVISSIDEIAISANAPPIERVRYLGHTGDFFFYLNPSTSAVVITKFKDEKTLVLKHFSVAVESSPKKEH